MGSEEPAPKRRRTGATGAILPGQGVGTPDLFGVGDADDSAADPDAMDIAQLADANGGEDALQNGQGANDGAVLNDHPGPSRDGGHEPSEDGSLDLTSLDRVIEAPLISDRTGAFSQREIFFQQQEEKGAFSFRYLKNDGTPDHNLWLLALKNIFSRQLPNMPKEYITRLVFDRRHRSVAVVREDGSVVGGITYRPFHEQGFGEIAFCAVSASDQVKGFGSRLMSYTKEYAKEQDQLTHFLTYADNNAVTFFAKQGFTASVTLDRSRWYGYIKDYDGGTLMESVLHRELPYTRLPQMIQTQRRAVDARVRSLSRAHYIYPGLRHFDSDNAAPLEVQAIPGVAESGWPPPPPPPIRLLVNGLEQPATPEAVHSLGREIVAALRAHEDAPAFCVPVRAEEVPDYYDIIKDPMDLSKIERKLESGRFYLTLELLQADIRRIFRNAQIYNAVDTYWYKAAGRLENFFNQLLAHRVVPAQ